MTFRAGNDVPLNLPSLWRWGYIATAIAEDIPDAFSEAEMLVTNREPHHEQSAFAAAPDRGAQEAMNAYAGRIAGKDKGDRA